MTLTVSGMPTTSEEFTTEDVLIVNELTVDFVGKRRELRVVRGVSFRVHAGETLVLLGESGSGKSVTARALLGLYGTRAALGGQVGLDGRSLLELDESAMRAVRGARIGMVPQDPTGALDPLRRIGRQIVEMLRHHQVAKTRSEAMARAEELLVTVGVADPKRVARSYPHELSGGLRQRAVIALTVACGPRMLIADEPTTALDATVQAQVLDLFATLQREQHMGLLLVTHDVEVARQVADRVAVMYAGRIVEEGPAEEVLARPRHPYTAALLASVPTPEVRRGELLAIPGRPPAPGEVPENACAFAPRCPAATDACRSRLPAPVEIGPSHRSACLISASYEPGASPTGNFYPDAQKGGPQ